MRYIPKTGESDTLFYTKEVIDDSWYYLITDPTGDKYILHEGEGAEIKNRGTGIGRVFVSVINEELEFSE